ncbi:hypothetical protein BVRB_8g182420 [Beta vulgaris subsp. vulgaris]|uniref:glutaredoxin-C9 n=1 Tax=Beta vulgaris subsp. vulgaris TaxID=3555 RepID=UPI00053FC916|nr:glutaredoxin-C9 [Beta vulgaris subsp. vulgaris]KMT04586.1 hypothetical protein BVRB_8g182420 [Beta vulgaris subsp. vulgaris]
MQEALPFKRWETLTATPMASASHIGNEIGSDTIIKMENLVKENPVIVFGKKGCCMCHVVRKLLLGLGVNPPIFEIDGHVNESLMVSSFSNIGENNNNLQLPVVFVGGELFGGLEKVMATHLSGELVPILKQAGALWL